MSAGAIRAPLIIPLRVPEDGVPKSHIDSNTRLEILSETPNVDIYFTINGSRPAIARHEKDLLNTGTYKFQKPFTLPPGTQTVRAIAFSPNTGGESNVVTKTFDVAKSKKPKGNSNQPNDYGFLDDLKQIESHRKPRSNGLNKPSTQDLIRQMLNGTHDKVKPSGVLKASTRRVKSSPDGLEEHNSQSSTTSPQRKENIPQIQSAEESVAHSRETAPYRQTASSLPDPNVPLTQLQRLIDVVHCPHCFHTRSANPRHQFCAHCGQSLPKLPFPSQPEPVLDQLGTCQTCGSKVPLNLSSCLVCEQSLRASPRAVSARTHDYRVCKTCGTPNPSQVTSCLTCEARLPTEVTRITHPNTVTFAPVTSPPVPTAMWSSSSNLAARTDSSQTGISFPYIACMHCHRQNNPDARYCDWCGLETQVLTNVTTNQTVSGGLAPPSTTINSSTPMHGVGSSSVDLRNLRVFCTRCGAPAARDSKFCGECGSPIQPPARHTVWLEQLRTHAIGDLHHSTSTKPITPLTVANASTQTVGLFYPSSADLRRQSSLKQAPFGIEAQLRDRVPLLTAVSPGRGNDTHVVHSTPFTNFQLSR